MLLLVIDYITAIDSLLDAETDGCIADIVDEVLVLKRKIEMLLGRLTYVRCAGTKKVNTNQ